MWYYAMNNQQQGPVEKEILLQMLRSGQLEPNALVWHEGFGEWQPANTVAELQAALGAAENVGQGMAAAESVNASQNIGSEEVGTCAACGKSVPRNMLFPKDGRLYCFDCLRDVNSPDYYAASSAELASVPRRFAAIFIDGIILFVVAFILMFVIAIPFSLLGDGEIIQAMMELLARIVQFVLGAVYYTYFFSKYGATPGKMVMGIRVVREDGGPLSTRLALGRYFGMSLSALICGIGYLMACFDNENRTLHDRICHTRIITTR